MFLKHKIVGIVACMLVFSSCTIVTSGFDQNEPLPPSADVPVWEVGDTWVYDSEFWVSSTEITSEGMIFAGGGRYVLEVVDDAGDNYKLKAKVEPVCGKVTWGRFGFISTRLSSYNADIEIQKSDLGVIKHDAWMKAITWLSIGRIKLPIPIQIQTYRNTEFDPAFSILPFPLHDGDSGTYTNSSISEETVTSMFWGLIVTGSDDNINWHLGDVDYTVSYESMDVKAGTYDVFNVAGELFGGDEGHDYYHLYYSEEVGNLVKLEINIDYFSTGETYYYTELELVSTNYSP